MGKIISIANPKGGVGKTITSINLAAALAYLNQKVLLIDLDPKGDASKGIGIDTSCVEYNIYSIMLQHENIRKAIIRTKYSNLDVIAGSMNMAGFDIESQSIDNMKQIGVDLDEWRREVPLFKGKLDGRKPREDT